MTRLAAEEYKRRVEQVFDGSAARYEQAREEEVGFRRLSTWLLRHAGPGEGRRLLEVGCGAGSLLGPLRRAGFRYVAVDRSREMTLRCAARAQELQVEGGVVRADGGSLPFPSGSFDLVVAVGLLEYLPDYEIFLSEAARVLDRNGRLLLTVPSAVAPHALAVALFAQFPHAVRARLLGRDPRRPLHPIRARPLRLGRLRRDLTGAGMEMCSWRFGEFVFFPFDRLAPTMTARLARLLQPLGRFPLLSRMGSQMLIEAVRAPATAARPAPEAQGAW